MLFSALFGKKSMFRNSTFAAVFVTVFLLVYCVMLHVPALMMYAEMMLMFSPLLIVWMVYAIVKDTRHERNELNEEEFGYADKDKNELGIF
jgi:Flp pilus assembly protein TadB